MLEVKLFRETVRSKNVWRKVGFVNKSKASGDKVIHKDSVSVGGEKSVKVIGEQIVEGEINFLYVGKVGEANLTDKEVEVVAKHAKEDQNTFNKFYALQDMKEEEGGTTSCIGVLRKVKF